MTCGFRTPSHFPSNCPPLPHSENPGVYYRLVEDARNLSDRDFKSFAELGRVSRTPAALCRDCSVSLFDSSERARNFLLNQPDFGQRQIARVNLAGNHGVVHKTDPRSGHIDWWVPEGTSPRSFCDGAIE